ncbi:MAG: hypothetical protein JNL09_04630 [Anaerolineales bacterium]|nr:hypothetical protein [Anaerolineales bacterium]
MKTSPALHSFTHPMALFATVTLLLNALVFQPLWPNWLTGKLSDLAWMVLAPLLLAAELAPLGFGRAVRVFSLVAVGLTLVAAKSIAPLNAAVLQFFASFGFPLKLALDASDLIVLPGLLIPWHIWEYTPRPARITWAHSAALSFAVLALLADSPAPRPPAFDCIEEEPEGSLIARRSYISYAYFSGEQRESTYFVSEDGGRTWAENPNQDDEKFYCTIKTQSAIGLDEDARDFFAVAGQGVYVSADAGQTLTREKELPTIYDLEAHWSTNTLIVAAEDLWVRMPDGEWTLALKGSE